MIKHILARACILLFLASGLTVAASGAGSQSAEAAKAYPSCKAKQYGKHRGVRKSHVKSYHLTEVKRVEVTKGSTYQRNMKWSVTDSRTNSIKTSVSATAKIKAAVWADVELSMGVELGTSTTKSVHREESESWTLTDPGVWRVARGFVSYTGKADVQRCVRSTQGPSGPDGYIYSWRSVGTATVKGHDEINASVKCSKKYSSGFRAFIKRKTC